MNVMYVIACVLCTRTAFLGGSNEVFLYCENNWLKMVNLYVFSATLAKILIITYHEIGLLILVWIRKISIIWNLRLFFILWSADSINSQKKVKMARKKWEKVWEYTYIIININTWNYLYWKTQKIQGGPFCSGPSTYGFHFQDERKNT